MTAVLRASDLAVGRCGRVVLSGIDLSVHNGERVALVGVNGSGKTTLLRVLAGLDTPLSGAVHWQEKPLPPGVERVRTLGVLFQTEVPTRFTVRELVTLGLGLDGPPTEPAMRDVEEVLGWAELDGFAARPCTSLSGGEYQRAALARASVPRPRVLLLDEPTNHLDPARRAALFAQLEELQGDAAIVLATHDLDLAGNCDRVALLHAGRIDSVGTPSEVLTPDHLARTMGVRIRRVDDPSGGPPFIRVVAPVEREVAA